MGYLGIAAHAAVMAGFGYVTYTSLVDGCQADQEKVDTPAKTVESKSDNFFVESYQSLKSIISGKK